MRSRPAAPATQQPAGQFLLDNPTCDQKNVTGAAPRLAAPMELSLNQLSEGLIASLKLAQGYAADRGTDEITGEGLFLAVKTDAATREALAAAGAPQRYLALTEHALAHITPVRELRPSAVVSQTIADAAGLARRNEHCETEPGHVAVVLFDDPSSAGFKSIVDNGIDVAEVKRRLVAVLPTVEPSEAEILTADAEFPPLAYSEVQQLAYDLVAWQQAEPRLDADRGSLAPDELRDLEDYQRLGEAVGRLHQHHFYLAIAVARDCAAQGHRLAYAYRLALRSLTSATHTYLDPSEDFTPFVHNKMKQHLADVLGCTLD